MALFRGLFFVLLLGAAILFALYAVTGQSKYRKFGLRIVIGTLLAAFGFFAVLIVQRVA
ncbi:MAG: hypothetical protein P4L96_02665 [Rhodoferax sp.]|nr:hypothetical protein [Rhodoferax sp.]